MHAQEAVDHYNRPRHGRKAPKKKLWFKCRHALPRAKKLESVRGDQEAFDVFVGNYLTPIAVRIKKIKHLGLSRRFGKRVRLILEHRRRNKFFQLTVIYNKDNGSMVIAPVPKFLWQ